MEQVGAGQLPDGIGEQQTEDITQRKVQAHDEAGMAQGETEVTRRCPLGGTLPG
jgi:hypothetical protein